MNSFYSTTQADDDVFAPWADPLWATGGHSYSSTPQGIYHVGFESSDIHNFNATNDMTFSATPITSMGAHTSRLAEESYMDPDVPDPWSIPAQLLLDASSVTYQPVDNPHYAGVSPIATHSVAATFNEGMSPYDSLTSPTSVDQGAWISEPGRSTFTTPSPSYGSGGDAGWVAPAYGANLFGVVTSPAEWGISKPSGFTAGTFAPMVAPAKRRSEAEEPRGHRDPVWIDTYDVPPQKRARRGGTTTGILKAARSVARTRHKPVTRIPKTRTVGKPKAGRGAERLATPNAQDVYPQSLLGPLQQGWAEETADGRLIWVEGRADEKVVHHNDSTVQQKKKQGKKEKEDKLKVPETLKPMHRALLKATKEELASRVEEIKCRLCDKRLKTWEQFKRHCDNVEAHPSEISFCDHCGDFFARKDSLDRHRDKPPLECDRVTKEESAEKCKETRLAYKEFSKRLEECLETGKDIGMTFSQIIKTKYPESAKKRTGGGKVGSGDDGQC